MEKSENPCLQHFYIDCKSQINFQNIWILIRLWNYRDWSPSVAPDIIFQPKSVDIFLKISRKSYVVDCWYSFELTAEKFQWVPIALDKRSSQIFFWVLHKNVLWIKLPYLPYVFRQTGLSKQFRPRWDASECGISSGSTLFATHPAIFRHNIG